MPSSDRPSDEALLEFGQLAKRLRNASGKSLRAMANEVGVTASYLGIIESGKNPKTDTPSWPKLQLVVRLARAFGCEEKDARTLASLANYELDAGLEERGVARLLKSGYRPDVFVDLEQLERDLSGYVRSNPVVEAPIFTVLRHFDAEESSDVYITGRAFRAAHEPALLCVDRRLYEGEDGYLRHKVERLRQREPLDVDLKIAVMGQFMTPTVLLLRHLAQCGSTYKVSNSRQPDLSMSGPRGADDSSPVEIEVRYTDDSQLTLLEVGQVDLALMVFPFRGVGEDTPYRPVDLDLWTHYRDAQMPMSLVVTSKHDLVSDQRREALVNHMEGLQVSYQFMIGDGLADAREALVAYDDPDPREHPAAQLANFDELYLGADDRSHLAQDLAKLSQLAHKVGLLESAREPEDYEEHIVTREELFKRTGVSL